MEGEAVSTNKSPKTAQIREKGKSKREGKTTAKWIRRNCYENQRKI